MTSWRYRLWANNLQYYSIVLVFCSCLPVMFLDPTTDWITTLFWMLCFLNVVFHLLIRSHRIFLADVQPSFIKATSTNPTHKQLHHLVDEMSIAASLRTPPKICIIDQPYCNAFTVGVTEHDYTIVLSSTLVQLLSRSELQAVIAHEITHIQQNYIKLNVLLSLMLHWPTYLYELFIKKHIKEGSELLGRIYFIAIILTLFPVFLFPLLMLILLKHNQRYAADIHTIRLTRRKQPFIDALTTIHQHHIDHTDTMKKSYNQNLIELTRYMLYFYHPRSAGIMNHLNPLAWLKSFFPPIRKRLKKLGSAC